MTNAIHYPWHDGQWRQIATARASARLPHAILLAGPAGLGKAAFARRLSNSLVCPETDQNGDACGTCASCRAAAAGTHPDQRFVIPEGPGKAVKIDAIRAVSAASVLSGQQGGHRVFVIDPADAMNNAAANALLKTLEEPASKTVLVLVSSRPDRLAPTIRSRCQLLKFSMPAGAVVRTWLAGQVGETDLDALLAVSGGAPLRALQAQEEGWLEAGRRLARDLQFLKGRQRNPLTIVQEWEKQPLYLLSDSLKRCLSDLVKLASGLRDAVIYHPEMRADLQNLSEGIDLQMLYDFNDELLRLERETSNNLNLQMQLELIVNRWLQITRPGGH